MFENYSRNLQGSLHSTANTTRAPGKETKPAVRGLIYRLQVAIPLFVSLLCRSQRAVQGDSASLIADLGTDILFPTPRKPPGDVPTLGDDPNWF